MSRNFLCRLLGSVIVGKYPAANYRGVLPRYEERKVLVRGVRDTSRDKLDPITTKLDPLLMRGRYLVTGGDLEKQEERSFYLNRFLYYRIEPPHKRNRM